MVSIVIGKKRDFAIICDVKERGEKLLDWFWGCFKGC
jgi:hypothetical protein